MDRCKPGASSHFITSPRSLNHSGQNSLCLLDWEAQPDPTHALQPDKPSDGNNNDHEEQISGLNKKLHEKNSKLAIKLQRTREVSVLWNCIYMAVIAAILSQCLVSKASHCHVGAFGEG